MSEVALYGTSGAVMAYLIIKEVAAILNKRKNGNGTKENMKEHIEMGATLRTLVDVTTNLVKIHEGADNKKIGEEVHDIWYERNTLKKTSDKLYTAVDTLTLSINANSDIMKANGKVMTELCKMINENGKKQ